MKILYISFGKHQSTLERALRQASSEFVQIDWLENPSTLDYRIIEVLAWFAPEITFMQLQREGLVNPSTLQQIGGKRYNWTGDVVSPIPQWYIDLAPYFDLTLFSNETDVAEFKRLGLRSEFLNIGFEERYFYPNGKQIPAGIVFMGNNHGTYPLSAFRLQMVSDIPCLEVYGRGWPKNDTPYIKLIRFVVRKFHLRGALWAKLTNDLNSDPETEGAIYRGCKMAINLSHFNYSRYSSDRMLRIMACGASCLTHHYEGLETDFDLGIDLVAWRSLEELMHLIDYYSAHPHEAEAIAHSGCNKVWGHHRWSHRIHDLLEFSSKH